MGAHLVLALTSALCARQAFNRHDAGKVGKIQRKVRALGQAGEMRGWDLITITSWQFRVLRVPSGYGAEYV